MQLDSTTGLLDQASFLVSPNHDERPPGNAIEAIIIHCISLPPGIYGGDQVERFFQNQLSGDEHPYFAEMAHLTVSSHFYIQRSGELIQFVPTHKRAWHAGESHCLQRARVNDFSIGVELEGLDTDTAGFSDEQYQTLTDLLACLQASYPQIGRQIFAHSDIAPERKPDPGPFFDWSRLEAFF